VDSVRPLIESAFSGTKVTCFAYGQTGSGKTFTMMGKSDSGSPGLYVLSAFDIFRCLQHEAYNHLEVWVSFYEIYCGKLYDLLNDKNQLHAREDGKQNICIVGLTEKQVVNFTEIMQEIEKGLRSRTVGVTGANSDSSRSHGIIQICLKETNGNIYGKISFIDLAGSERAVDIKETNKQTRMDGAEINKSLLALKECIRALDQDKPYLPFRGSKLTLVLRDSFVGNCKTLMIANVSPCLSCAEHTLNTLRYADRVKELKKEKNQEVEKDPQDLMANIMMMPRQHSKLNLTLDKTVKYNVDKTNKRQSVSNPIIGQNNLKKSNSNNTSSNNIAQLFQPSQQPMPSNTKGTISTIAINSYNNPNKENSNYSNYEATISNLLMGNVQTNPVPNNINTFNNNPKPVQNIKPATTTISLNLQNSRANYQANNQPSTFSLDNKTKPVEDDEDLQELTQRHSKLVNKIIVEEESYIENHKTHINEMFELMQEVFID
jgi:kinesin family protein 2/24